MSTLDDFIAARKLIASAFYAAPADGFTTAEYHHDHDEELGMYWHHGPAPSTDVAPTLRPLAYWVKTGRMVREYLVLQAGPAYSEALRQGFITWLKRSPGQRRQYEDGDDMARAALVDWYLRLVR